MSSQSTGKDPARSLADAPTLSAESRFGSIDRVYGRGSLQQMRTRHVAVVGLGGVGSWAVEALVRSGIGTLTLIDADDICIGNANRQLHAMDGNYGRAKAAVLAERARLINPECAVHSVECFVTPVNLRETIVEEFDLVLDCCDAFRTKVEMIALCRRRKQPLVVCGSAGGRVDPTRITVRDLSRTEHDALLAMIRRKLRSEFNFPRGPTRYFSVPAVYSLENVRYPQADGSVRGLRPAGVDAGRLDCGEGLGAVMHVTAAFAMAAVATALERLLRMPGSNTSDDAG